MTDIVREYLSVSTFRGKPEDVPIAEGVDVEDIKAADPNALYVTLPIAEIGSVSNNGLLYDEALVDSIAAQINADRPGGIFGHLKDEERSTSFPLPAGMWVGAKRVGETLWAKAYIPPSAARDYVQNLKRVGGAIATSIYGKGDFEKVRTGVRRLTNFKLESLDFAPPSRAALGLGAIPHVTAEMDLEQEPIMADKAQVIAELTLGDIPAALREQIVAEASRKDETAQTISELTNTVKAKDDVIAELTAAVDGYRTKALQGAIDSTVAELTDWQVNDDAGKDKLASLRDLLRKQILTRLGNEQTMERVSEIAAAAWTDIKPIAEMVRDALAGPPAIVTGKPQGYGGRKTEPPTEQEQRAAMNKMGITV